MSVLGQTFRRRQRWWDTGCAPFDLLPDRTRQALCRRGDQYTVWPGQTVVAAGDRVNWVFVVLDGELALRRGRTDLAVLKPGCLYGALDAIACQRLAPGDLVARDVSRVLALPVTAYSALIATDVDFANWVILALAQQGEAA